MPFNLGGALAPLAGADHGHGAVLVEAQQLREPELEPGGDPLGDLEGRARLSPFDLREHRCAHPRAFGKIAQGQVHGLT